MAGDSCVSDEHGARRYTSDPKVWTQHGYVIGVAGDAGADRALRAVPWEHSQDWFLRRAWGALKQQCAAHEVEEVEAIIGFQGRLYGFDGDLYQIDGRFVGAGCGAAIVEGFLAASKLPPLRRVRAAVHEAALRCDGVGGRIRVVCD